MSGLVRAVVAALLVGTLGCAASRPAPLIAPADTPVSAAGTYQLQPGDVIEVKFAYHEKENQKVVVRPDGAIALPIAGDVAVMGLTAEEASARIAEQASRYLRDPVVSVVLTENGARCYVGGEVTSQGFVVLGKPTTVLQAIVERGGLRAFANPSQVVVISQREDGRVTRIIDLEVVMDGDEPDTEVVVPNDIVFVPMTGIGEANKFVDQWINGLTPDILKSFRTSPVF